MARANSKAQPTLTTAQKLSSLIKSARAIMRKDTGLNGDLDRLPQLTWIMFLKFLDDMERVRETEAAFGQAGHAAHDPVLEAPYRWRDWAADANYVAPDAWLESAPRQEGSWWTAWLDWLQARSGKPVPPPASGAPERGYPVVADAPGEYVRQK